MSRRRSRTLLALSTILATAVSASGAWTGSFESEVRKFSVVEGGGVYSPAFEPRTGPLNSIIYEVPDDLGHNFDVSRLKPATIEYRDDSGRVQRGRLTTSYTHYWFSGRIVFRQAGGESRFVSAEGLGFAEATWSMTFGDGSKANGTFVARGIRLETENRQAVLYIPFGVQVSAASGPLAGDAGHLTGSCPRPQHCSALSVVRFVPTEEQLVERDLTRAFAAAVTKKRGKLRLRLRPGPGRTHFALPRSGFVSDFAKHRIVATTTPGARCTPRYERVGSGARTAAREDVERLYRSGVINLDTFESILRGEAQGRSARVQALRITIACRKDGVALPSATRVVRVRR